MTDSFGSGESGAQSVEQQQTNIAGTVYALQHGDQYIYEGLAYPRIDYRQEISRLITFYTQVFVGRDRELSHLVRYSAQSTPSYLLIEAPPAFGKSALVAQAIHRHEKGQWSGQSPDLLYFFIREDGRRHTSDAFCSALNSQLLQLLGVRSGIPPDLESQRNQLLQLWKRAIHRAGRDQPLLLLVDGLDEMARGELTIADVLPSDLEPYVHVVITSRPNPKPLDEVSVEHPLRQAEVLRLGLLNLENIEQLLSTRASTTEPARDLAKGVLDITGGEPLLARFISEDVVVGGEQALAQFRKDPPKGVKDYFRRQFGQLDARAQGDTAWEILGLLLIAQGAMAIDELAAVLQLPMRQIRKALAPIQRFLLGRDRIELMHLELRAVVAEQFSPIERQAYRRRLLEWCDYFARQDWPEDTPEYVLEYYAVHLREVGDNDSLYALINRRWMDLKASRTHSYRSFAQDVLHAIDAAMSEIPPNLGQEIRGTIVYTTLSSMARSVPPEILGILASAGLLVRAEGYVGLIVAPGQRSRAYGEIAAALFKLNQTELANSNVQQALAATQLIRGASARAQAQVAIAEMLGHAGQGERALTIVQAIKGDTTRVQGLSAVAEALIQAGQVEQAIAGANQALIAADSVGGAVKARAMARAGQVLARAGHADKAVAAAEKAVAVIQEYAANANRRQSGLIVSQALTEAAVAFVWAGRPSEAIATIEKIPGPLVDEALAQVVRPMCQVGMIKEARAATRAIEHHWFDNRAVVWVMAQAGQAEEAISTAKKVGTRRNERLAEVAEALAETGRAEEALAASHAITRSLIRAQALAAVAQVLVRAGQIPQAVAAAEQALSGAQTVEGASARGQVLAAVAQELVRIGQVERAFLVMEAIKSTATRAQALATVARLLAEVGQVERAVSTAEQALSIARLVGGALAKPEALASVAQELFQAKLMEHAVVAAQEAFTTAARGLHIPFRRAALQAAMVEVMAGAGRIEEAAAAAGSIEIDRWRVIALARAGRVDDALALAQSTKYPSVKAEALGAVAKELVKVGRIEQALAIAKSIEFRSAEAEVLAEVAQELAKSGENEQAVAIIEQSLVAVRRTQSRSSIEETVFANAAWVWANGGRVDRAVATAEEIGMRWIRASALAQIAKVVAQAGQAELATELASRTLEAVRDASWIPQWQLAALPVVLAEACQANVAITMVQSIDDPSIKGRVLGSMTAALAQAGEVDSAIAVAEKALAEARRLRRSDLFEILTNLAPVFRLLDVDGGLLVITESLLELEQWWGEGEV